MADNSGNGDERTVASVDRLVHEPARFMILAHLYVVESADFVYLIRQTGLTWGNLSSHLSKLEAAGYVTIEKEFLGKKPHTMLGITENGRTAFDIYRRDMKKMLEI